MTLRSEDMNSEKFKEWKYKNKVTHRVIADGMGCTETHVRNLMNDVYTYPNWKAVTNFIFWYERKDL